MSLFLNLLFEQIPNSNAYLLAKFGFDTDENEPPKVWGGGRVLSARHCCVRFYTCPVDKSCRSRTNIPFVIKGGNDALEKK